MSTYTNAVPGPEDITRRELPNGIVVLVRENFNANSVVITGSVDAGSLFDPDDTEGLAAFTSASLMRGTLNRDFATIHEMLEGNGASLSASSGIHTAGFSGKSLAEDLPMLLDLLADVLRNPAFPERQVERLRGVGCIVSLVVVIQIVAGHTLQIHHVANHLMVIGMHPKRCRTGFFVQPERR